MTRSESMLLYILVERLGGEVTVSQEELLSVPHNADIQVSKNLDTLDIIYRIKL